MALDTTSHDIYRGTTGLQLPPDVSREVFQGAIAQSAVMKLAERIELPGRGLAIPVITGDPTAFIANEAAEKNVDNSAFDTKFMAPVKFAVIELFSDEFKRDYDALYEQLIRRLPGSIAKAFDDEIFNAVSTPTGFDSLNGVTTVADIPTGMQTIAQGGYRMNGIAASAAAEVDLITATNQLGVPLFISDPQDGKLGRVYGAPVVPCDAITGLVAGDWSQCKYGIVDDIKVKFSEEATINDGSAQINLWQRNMFAVLVEAELGFVCADTNAFFAVDASASE